MAKRERMTTYSRAEVKDALDAYGFVVSRKGKGSHKIYEHKVFGDMLAFEISDHGEVDENVYKNMIAVFALLTLTTDSKPEDLGKIRLYKMQKSVEVSLRNQGYRKILLRMLKSYRDENGQKYDNDRQFDKFISKMKKMYEEYKSKKINKKGDDSDESRK